MPSATLTTRVGRRIVLLFVLSALLPILALGAVGYLQVRGQLLSQSQDQLELAAKSVGMGVLDQLRILTGGRGATLQIVPAGDSAAIWLVLQDGTPRRELRPEVLFRGALDRAAVGTAETSVCITDTGSGLPLYCENRNPGSHQVSARWELFLAYDFATPPWRIDVSVSRAVVLAPVLSFRRTLLATLVGVLGLVVALSSIQVRRSLDPLRALRDGTRRLTARDFSQTVAVRSGDEFQELAESFNQMATELDGQFKDNERLITRLNELSWGALAALARTVDASSPWTAGHSERVTALSMRMATRLKLGVVECETLHRGGLLHDIGKIGIAPDILDKPGALLPAELAVIREHPVLGARILEPLSAFAEAIPIVRSHHEKYDGTGYPDRLAGDNIPMLARLLAVADVYDALVSTRPYRDGWTHEAALAEIRKCRGTHFEPRMVDVFLAVIEEHGDAARFHLAEAVTA